MSVFATTVQEGMRCWNMTVQYWLARNVYKRLPLRSAPLKSVSLPSRLIGSVCVRASVCECVCDDGAGRDALLEHDCTVLAREKRLQAPASPLSTSEVSLSAI